MTMATEERLNEDGKPMKDPWAMPEFTQHIELSDGTVFNGYAVATDDGDELWVRLTDRGLKFEDVYAVFGNAQNTNLITSYTTILDTEKFFGFTRLTTIQQDKRYTTVRLRLGK